MSFDYYQSVIGKMRKGTADDSFVDVNETLQVVNSKVVLSEIPDKFNGLVVKTVFGNTTLTEIKKGTPTDNQYLCDYNLGIVHFSETVNGERYVFSYKGRGSVYLAAERIYTKQMNSNEIIQTLRDILDEADSIINLSERFTNKGAYSSSTVYYGRNIVTYDNASYMCINNTADGIINVPPTNTTNWRLIVSVKSAVDAANAAASSANTAASNANTATTNANNAADYATEQGDYAKGIRDNFGHKGDYSPTATYKNGNVVSYGGINYFCIQDTTAGIDPLNGAYWTVVSPQASINDETWTATEGQTVFTITNGNYVTGQGNIEVFVGGVQQVSGIGYTETNSTTITLSDGVAAGTIVFAKWFEGHMSIAKGHKSSHALGGQDEIDLTQLRNYKEKVSDEFVRVDAQLADGANNINSRLIKMLNAGQVSKIKLIGDSITAGVGCDGYYLGTERVIINRGGSDVYEAGKDWTIFPSWANLFRKYIETNYTGITFLNNGVGGIRTEEVVNTYLTDLIDDNEDVVFVMLGMNDRDPRTLAQYKADIEYLLDYINQRSSLMIVMTPTPATSDFTDNTYTTYQYDFGVREIDAVLTEVCSENQYIHISHYRHVLDYLSKSKTDILKVVQDGGSHPITLGYKIMWQNIQKQLGFINDLKEWFVKDSTLVNSNDIMPNCPINLFPIGVSYSRITTSQATSANFPKSTGGLLTTVRAVENVDGYIYQLYTLYLTGEIYTRSYNSSTSSWTEWVNYKYKVADGLTSTPTPSSYNTGVTHQYVTASNASSFGLPEGAAGLLVTTKPRSSADGWMNQQYYLYDSSKVYTRSYSPGINNWGNWSILNGSVMSETSNQVLNSTPITSFPVNQKTYYPIANSNTEIANFPEGKAGMLETVRPKSGWELYAYQTYHISQSNSVYKRFWNTTTGAWSAWSKISAV